MDQFLSDLRCHSILWYSTQGYSKCIKCEVFTVSFPVIENGNASHLKLMLDKKINAPLIEAKCKEGQSVPEFSEWLRERNYIDTYEELILDLCKRREAKEVIKIKVNGLSYFVLRPDVRKRQLLLTWVKEYKGEEWRKK